MKEILEELKIQGRRQVEFNKQMLKFMEENKKEQTTMKAVQFEFMKQSLFTLRRIHDTTSDMLINQKEKEQNTILSKIMRFVRREK